MARYRIPRRTGLGEDILDTGPMEQAIAAQAAESAALANRVAALEERPVAKASVGGGPGYTPPPWVAVTATVPNSSYSHRELISAPSASPTSIVEVILAPTDDTDENDPELLDIMVLHAIPAPASGQIEILMTFSAPTRGPIKLLYRIN